VFATGIGGGLLNRAAFDFTQYMRLRGKLCRQAKAERGSF